MWRISAERLHLLPTSSFSRPYQILIFYHRSCRFYLILYELVALLVDAVVGQMRKFALWSPEAALVKRFFIRLSGEAHEPFLVDVDAQWLEGGDEHVDAKIELVPVDQKRVTNVPRGARREIRTC